MLDLFLLEKIQEKLRFEEEKGKQSRPKSGRSASNIRQRGELHLSCLISTGTQICLFAYPNTLGQGMI